jgi:hypothetical protein
MKLYKEAIKNCFVSNSFELKLKNYYLEALFLELKEYQKHYIILKYPKRYLLI